MTGLVRKATLFGVCALLAASSAFALVPDPGASTVPSHIFVVVPASVSGGVATPDNDGANGPSYAAPGPVQAADPQPQLQRISQRRDQLARDSASAALEVRAVLTPEQLARVAQTKERLRQLREEMRQLMQPARP